MIEVTCVDTTYFAVFRQLKFDLLEGEWCAFGLEAGDFVVFGELRCHLDDQ